MTGPELTRCDNHPAAGGSHSSRALVVRPYLDHDATIVRCTAPVGRRGKTCDNEYLVFGRPQPVQCPTQCMWCGGEDFGGFAGPTAQYLVGGDEVTFHPPCAEEAKEFHQSRWEHLR